VDAYETDNVLVRRLLPRTNRDPKDRAAAWNEWYHQIGASAVLAFVRVKNDTPEPDMDIVQDAMMIAYTEVERGRYEPRAGIPFTAYVKGIARNKIREARRRSRRYVLVDEIPEWQSVGEGHALEVRAERREEAAFLHAALPALPDCRQRVLRQYLNGRTTAEIARTLGMSEDAVRQHKCRGLRSLRQLQANRE
jgi:RNA polymerase sigma factor (sigma-70 family)